MMRHRQHGFTLIELVVTLTVSAIMAIGVISWLADSVDGFTASSQRSKLASSGRIAVDRIAMELHNAVPNSIRASGECLEFLPAVAATTYLDAPFTNSAVSFQAVTPALGDVSEAVYAVIFPVNSGSLYDAGAVGASTGPIALVESIDTATLADENKIIIELSDAHQFLNRSPVDRLYLAGEPVSFCKDGERLFRYQGEGYGLQSDQCEPDTCLPAALPGRVLVSMPLGFADFHVGTPTLRRNALVNLQLNFSEAGDEVNIHHEVLTRNVP